MDKIIFITAFLISTIETDCGKQKITAENGLTGFVTSPNFPRPYPPKQNCLFHFVAQPGFVVHITFTDFDLENKYFKSEQCLNDFVILVITDNDGRDFVGKRLCGFEIPDSVRTMQRSVKLRFVSTYPSRKKGFRLRYEFIPESQVLQPPSFYGDVDIRWKRQCGGHNSEHQIDGEIISPGFPSTFPRNVSCHWLIRVPAEKRVFIRLVHLELSPTMAECDRASLYIIDGYKYELLESATARRWMDQINEVRFCGGKGYYNEEGMKSYLSQGNRVIVKFVTKENPSAEQHLKYEEEGLPIGFKLLWTEVSSLISETGNDPPCDGFMCRGGEFCIDSADAICAERTRLCINKTLQCNGVANCAENDNSDEHNCYSDHIAWTAVGIFSFIFVCTILTMIFHRISIRREIQKRIREGVKSQRGQMTNQNGHQITRQFSDSSRTPATVNVSRTRRMSPAFFTWTRRPTVESITTPSLALQQSLLNQNETTSEQNNVWQIAKEQSPQPPRVRLQPLTITTLSRSDQPLSFENLETSQNANEIFRYSQTAIV